MPVHMTGGGWGREGAVADGTREPVRKVLVYCESVRDHTRLPLRWVLAFGLIIEARGVWRDAVPALSFVRSMELWAWTVPVADGTTAGAERGGAAGQSRTEVVPVELADLFLSVTLAGATIVLAARGPTLLGILLLLRLLIEPGRGLRSPRFSVMPSRSSGLFLLLRPSASVGGRFSGWRRP
jgi:hypothetical protein